MIRTLLATTAVAALFATASLAQDASSSAMPSDTSSMASSSMMPSDASSSMMASDMSSSSMMASDMSSEPMATPTPRTPVTILSGYTRVDTDQLATKIIGSPVYDGTATNANNLGNINDLVLNKNGQVAAVVIGVGGFLGIGEKQVAVDFTALKFMTADDNTERFVLQTTVDDLKNAPDFQAVDDTPNQPSPSAPATSNDTMAPSASASAGVDTNGNAAMDLDLSSSSQQQ